MWKEIIFKENGIKQSWIGELTNLIREHPNCKVIEIIEHKKSSKSGGLVHGR